MFDIWKFDSIIGEIILKFLKKNFAVMAAVAIVTTPVAPMAIRGGVGVPVSQVIPGNMCVCVIWLQDILFKKNK